MNGLRPITEFVYGGELRKMPDPEASDDKAWSAYVHYRDNAPGIKKEWWYHAPSGTWFIAERNTLSDEVLTTYLFGKATQTKAPKALKSGKKSEQSK